VEAAGPFLKSPLLITDTKKRGLYEHLEYRPFVNARAHALGKKREILNDRFKEQYTKFLDELAFKSELDNEDLLAATYYLLIQDRISEAISFFEKAEVNGGGELEIQYDYLATYLDFYNEDPKKAREIVKKYENYPIPKWHKLFAQIKDKLKELDLGEKGDVVDDKSRDEKQAKVAAAEPSLDLTVEGKSMIINYRNAKSVTIAFYKMDVELLFSSSPFVQGNLKHFLNITPNTQMEVDLDGNVGEKKVEIPKEYLNANVMIDVRSGSVHTSKAHFSHSLSVHLIENYGLVKVYDKESGRPLPKTYVKVYSKNTSGSTEFFKDGYTDLTGAFDYTSVMTDALDKAQKFSILIMSEKNGSVIREASKPKS